MSKLALAVIALVSTILVLTLVTVLTRGGQSGTNGVIPAGPEAPSIRTDPETGAAVLTPREGLEGLVIPEFTLTRQDGAAVTEETLEGGLTIVTFIFTNCQLACPPMMGAMSHVAEELEGSPVRFLSISVDPEHDTPERLAEFAELWQVDTSRWQFLRGEPGDAERILAALHFSLATDPSEKNRITLPDGSTMQNIQHPTQLLLVGPDRQVVDLFSSNIPDQLDQLVELVRSVTG